MRLWARWSALRDWRVRRVHSDRQTLIRQGCECRFRPFHDSLLSFPLSVNLLRVRSVEMGPNDSTMTSTSNVNWLMSLNRPPEVSASRYETMAGSGRPRTCVASARPALYSKPLDTWRLTLDYGAYLTSAKELGKRTNSRRSRNEPGTRTLLQYYTRYSPLDRGKPVLSSATPRFTGPSHIFYRPNGVPTCFFTSKPQI